MMPIFIQNDISKNFMRNVEMDVTVVSFLIIFTHCYSEKVFFPCLFFTSYCTPNEKLVLEFRKKNYYTF